MDQIRVDDPSIDLKTHDWEIMLEAPLVQTVQIRAVDWKYHPNPRTLFNYLAVKIRIQFGFDPIRNWECGSQF